MTILMKAFILGSLQNNSYLLADKSTHQAAIIDPSDGSEVILREIITNHYQLTQVWFTHAHFDHFTGLDAILNAYPNVQIGLHPDDLPLWHEGGGANYFGIHMPVYADPGLLLTHGQKLSLSDSSIEVRHTPGHSPGHVIFYDPEAELAYCGDLIFQGSIGRTDLPGGDFDTIIKSIKTQVLTLPAGTRLLPGHGPETTVQQEAETNPFLLD
jgi:hydroxyacylglutathione hydrolase